MKWCYACKQHLPINMFGKNRHKKDGLSTECRACKKESDRKSYIQNRTKRLRVMQKHCIENKEVLNTKAREYARSNNGRELNNKATRRYYKRHREECLERTKKRNKIHKDKYVAEYTISNAIKLGKVTRPKACQSCNKLGRVEAHHPDYSKPLEVMWLCKRCHGKEHRRVR